MAPPSPPTLRLDSQGAWRQGEDAILLPIVYDFPDGARANPDATLIPIVSPATPPSSPKVTSQEKQGKNWASPERQAETEDVYTSEPDWTQPAETEFFFADAVPAKSRSLSNSVPLLLLAAIALVVFAWMAFR
jgi:hypothetical protein